MCIVHHSRTHGCWLVSSSYLLLKDSSYNHTLYWISVIINWAPLEYSSKGLVEVQIKCDMKNSVFYSVFLILSIPM